MIRVAGNYNVSAIFRGPFREVLHSGNKRAGGINDLRRAPFQIVLDLGRDAVCSNHGYRVGICFVRLVNCRHP